MSANNQLNGRLLPYSKIFPNYQQIIESPILVVGAGGIGCELLKDLVLSGFKHISIIDLDSVDVSNLNRQFLFREQHVGKSKAEVAKISALAFLSSQSNQAEHHCHIEAHHANIKSQQFNVEYFKKFALVMNALDNVNARQHVNRMCLAAEVPLLDGGTAGYLGQVMTIQKNRTECYECKPKQRQQSFAVCTIRSNPSTLLHCVVWAKMLFERLFGKSSDENAIADFENIQKIQNPKEFAEAAFDLVFRQQVDEAKEMKDTSVFHSGKRPVPLLLDNLVTDASQQQDKERDAVAPQGLPSDQVVWTNYQCATNFLSLAQKLRTLKQSSQKDMSFDKDDEMAMDFVTAAANLRAINYHIHPKSKYEIKGMAGNIVPAIATTNAIISGLLVLEAYKVLSNRLEDCRAIFCMRHTSRFRRKNCLIYPITLESPNPNCYVCSSNEVTVKVNCKETSFQYFIDNILRKELGMVEPTITYDRRLLFESGEELDEEDKADYEANGKQQLQELGIGKADRCELVVEDYAQDMDWKVIVVNDEEIKREDASIIGKVEHEKTETSNADEEEKESKEESKPVAIKENEGGEIDLISDDEESGSGPSLKRKREDGDDGDRPHKKK